MRFNAWAVRHAATEMSKFARCARPPEVEVSESRNCGHQPRTSRIALETSTRGIIAVTHLRSSISDSGSSIALMAATWTRPSASMLTAVLASTGSATAW